MANITTTVPNLIQGVSQQSPKIRLQGQCSEQINAITTITNGLTKRPPARLIKRLTDANIFKKGDFLHFVERSATERYVICIEHRSRGDNQGVLRAFNLDTGVEATIEGDVGGYTINNNYLTLTNPEDSHKLLKARTLGDSTFLLNTTITAAQGPEISDALDKTRALVFIKQGDYNKKYGLKFRQSGAFTGTGATFNVTWTRVRTGQRFDTSGYYKITSISIADGGTGYHKDDTPTLDFISDLDWVRRPEITTTVTLADENDEESGVITEVSLIHGGQTVTYRETPPSLPSVSRSTAPYQEVSIVTHSSSGTAKEKVTDSTNIAEQLTIALQGGNTSNTLTEDETKKSTSVAAEYSFTLKDGSIIINRNDGRDFYVEAFDGLNGSGLGIVHKETDALSDLPVRAPDGFRVAVRGDANENADDYYLRFESNDGQAFGEGGWVEDVGPEIATNIDENTLPLQLVSSAPNTFTLSTTGWVQRLVGDDETNPFPSFIGKTINNMIFFKNRFGFIFEDVIVMSEAGELFNFFRTTVRTLLDTAPIDVTSASPNVTSLRSSVTFQENLLMFGDRGQFVLKGDPLTNETITLSPTTNYDVDTTQDPIAVGSYVYFPFNRGKYLGLHEYSLNSTTDVYDSDEITTQIPSYITSGDLLITTASTAENMITICNGDNTIYVYKYFFNGREKVLSSWGKITMPFDVVSMSFMKSSLFIAGDKEGQSLLVEVKFEELRLEDDTTGGFTIHLDLLKKHTLALSSNIFQEAEIDLGFTPSITDEVEVYDIDGQRITVASVNNNIATIRGYLKTCFSGLKYRFEYTFSEPVFKQGNPPTTSGLARLALRNGTLFFSDASSFQVEVKPLARDTNVFSYSPYTISTDTVGSRPRKDGKFRFSIFTSAEDSVIKIVNTSAFASNFQSCEFEANVHTRSTRI